MAFYLFKANPERPLPISVADIKNQDKLRRLIQPHTGAVFHLDSTQEHDLTRELPENHPLRKYAVLFTPLSDKHGFIRYRRSDSEKEQSTPKQLSVGSERMAYFYNPVADKSKVDVRVILFQDDRNLRDLS